MKSPDHSSKKASSSPKEKNLGTTPEDPVKNLKIAEGKDVPNPAPNASEADTLPGKTTASGQYGVGDEEMDAEDFYAASNKLPDEPDLGSLK